MPTRKQILVMVDLADKIDVAQKRLNAICVTLHIGKRDYTRIGRILFYRTPGRIHYRTGEMAPNKFHSIKAPRPAKLVAGKKKVAGKR
jgi:hypothetical protein